MKRLFLYFSFLLSCFIDVSGVVRAQQRLPGEVPTPQAATLGSYGDIPVSLYSGALSLSIPIYSITVRGVTLDVRMDYDGSGIRMNSLPGNMGYGWTLNCGGVITRSVNGGYDDYDPYPNALPSIYNRLCYFRCYDMVDQLTSANLLTSQNVLNYDMQPDVFYFNFMGMAGRFFLGNDGQWKVMSDHNIDVIHDIHDSDFYDYPLFGKYPGNLVKNAPKTISKFILRDDRGNIYEFGGTNSAIEYSIGIFGMLENNTESSWKADAWYLTKVTDKLGNVLFEFDYGRGKYIAQVSHAYEIWFQEDLNTFLNVPTTYYTGGNNTAFPYQVTVNAPVHLSTVRCIGEEGVEITFRTDTVATPPHTMFSTFYSHFYPSGKLPHIDGEGLQYYYLQTDTYPEASYQQPNRNKANNPLGSTRPECFTEIRIRDYDLTAGKTIIPTYSYDGRIHMTGLSVYGGLSQNHNGCLADEKYTFGYYNYASLPADCSTTAIDHWGYYNGKNYTANQYGGSAFYANRNPDIQKMKYGALTSIVYPTGGEAVIDYEPHDFSKYVTKSKFGLSDSTGTAGGLRVKSVTLYEDVSRQKILSKKTYRYVNEDGTSSGILASVPLYYWPNWSDKPYGSTFGISLFRFSSVVPLSNSFGPHVGYSRVEEADGDSCRTVTWFTNHNQYRDDNYIYRPTRISSSPFDVFGDRGYKRGKPLKTERWDTAGNILSRTVYKYREADVDGVTQGCNMSIVGISNGEDSHYIGGVYPIHSSVWAVDTVVSTLYSDGGLETRSTYSWDVLSLPMAFPFFHRAKARRIWAETVNRGGDTSRRDIRYPHTYGYAFHLVCKDFDLVPCAVRQSFNGNEVRTDTTIYEVVTINGEVRPMPKYEQEKHGDTVTSVTRTYSQYTPTGRIRAYKDADGIPVWLYWGFYDNYLLGTCKGQEPPASEPVFSDSEVFLQDRMLDYFSDFRAANPHHHITSYTWHPMHGVTSVTPPDGNTVYYEYDDMLRLNATLDYYHKTISTHEYHYAR